MMINLCIYILICILIGCVINAKIIFLIMLLYNLNVSRAKKRTDA